MERFAKAYERGFMVRPVEKRRGRPTVGAERNDTLRALVRAIQRTDFDGNLTAMSKALGLRAGSLSDFLAGHRGAGPKLTDALVVYTRRSHDQILSTGGDLEALRSATAKVESPVRAIRFGDLPAWSELVASAREIAPSVPDWCWLKLRDADVWLEGPVTPRLVAELGGVIQRNLPPPA